MPPRTMKKLLDLVTVTALFETPGLQDAHLPSVLAFLLLREDFFGAVFGGAILT